MSQTVKDMPFPSLPASSDVAVTTELEISPIPKKKSKSEVAMEELVGKSSHISWESTEEFHKRKVEKIYQLWGKARIGLMEDLSQWWKESKKHKSSRTRSCCQSISSSADICTK